MAVVLAMATVPLADLVQVGISSSAFHVWVGDVVRHVVVHAVRPVSLVRPAPFEVDAHVGVPDLGPVAHVVPFIQDRELGALALG